MIDKQDAYEGTLDSYSSEGRDTFAVTSWTEANMNNCQTRPDSGRSRHGTSPKRETEFIAAGLRDMNPMAGTVAANGHHESVQIRRAIQENGYESPPEKQARELKKDLRHGHFEHRERPKNFETPVAWDSVPKGSASRHSEAWKIKDPSPVGEKDCNKTGNSHTEVTKIVPLKPQRSKKSINKENKDLNPQTHSQPDRGVFGAAGDVQMTKSSCESGRRLDDNAVPLSATDVVKENTMDTKHQGESTALYQQQSQTHQQIRNEFFGQQELRDCRDSAGQWTRGGVAFEENSQITSEFSAKFPAAPPRTLPLKTQWSRDRLSNMDNSHIHHRTPNQETAKRKQAVNHLPPFPPQPVCQSSESKALHELQAMWCKLFLPSKNKPSKKKKKSHTRINFRIHVAVYEKAKVHVPSHRLIDRLSSRPWPRGHFAFPSSPPQILTSAWPFQNAVGL